MGLSPRGSRVRASARIGWVAFSRGDGFGCCTPGREQSSPLPHTPKKPKGITHACSTVSSSCSSGTLLNGRGTRGPEANAPNTLNRGCADGTAGTYHSDESLDALRISTVNGSDLAAGKAVRVEATVWAWSGFSSDAFDLYQSTDGSATWSYVTTLVPSKAGA